MYGIFLTNCLRQGEKIRWTRRWADYVCMCTFYLPAFLYGIGFQGEGRQNPGSSHVRAPSGPLCMGMGRFNIKSFNYLQANEIYFPPKNHNTLTRGS
jgi:hypothetical protein